jgi:ubiquinone/menaquinone biosynthesis C-methylase UbiE
MDRQSWLDERRAAVRAISDAEAPTYDRNVYPTEAQHEWVARLLRMAPPGGLVLDAPCGTGRYFPMVVEAGLRVAGIDGSAGMLEQARARYRRSRWNRWRSRTWRGSGIDAVMTIDAMENVPPEDWPPVLRNLHRAVRPGGQSPMTVEEIDDAQIEAAFLDLSARGGGAATTSPSTRSRSTWSSDPCPRPPRARSRSTCSGSRRGWSRNDGRTRGSAPAPRGPR